MNGTELVAADSAIVLDLKGNLLWGHASQTKFGEEYKARDVYENLIDVENGAVCVTLGNRECRGHGACLPVQRNMG